MPKTDADGGPWLCIALTDKLPDHVQLAVKYLWDYEAAVSKLDNLKLAKDHIELEIARLEDE